MNRRSSIPGEFDLIARLAKLVASPRPSRPHVGIGDDASVLRLSPRHYQLATHDLLLEGVHFQPGSPRDFRDLGWKALAVNLSDIAAMGGSPRQALVGLGLPKEAQAREIEALYRGLRDCALEYRCPILGGDTNRSPGGWLVAVTVLGCIQRPPLLRSGAKPGDGLWVTGELGSAALGWRLIQSGDRSKLGAPFRRRHSRPEPRVAWGEIFLKSGMVSAMMDLSDGLGGDLRHLARSSGVGFRVELEALPRAKGFAAICRKLGFAERELLLSGGEDYELLLTVKAGREREFERLIRRHRIQAHRVGVATARRGVVFDEGGKSVRGRISGYTHF